MAGHSSKAASNKSHSTQHSVGHGSDGASTSNGNKTRLPGITGKANSLSEKYTNKLLNMSTYLFSTVLWKTKPMNSQDYDKSDARQPKSESDKYSIQGQMRQQQLLQQKDNNGNCGVGTNSGYFVNYSADYNQQKKSKDNKITAGNSHSSDANIVKPSIGKQNNRNSKSDEPFDDSQAHSAIARLRSISEVPAIGRQPSERLFLSRPLDSLQSFSGHHTTSSGHSDLVSSKDLLSSRSASSQSPQITTSHPATSTPSVVLCCDKCDGKHATDECPYYKKGTFS